MKVFVKTYGCPNEALLQYDFTIFEKFYNYS